jgi:uncharacterized protein (TIGR04255 family)
MAINEIFLNPTVKQVVFQIRYPSLFFMENKIGELQLKIMRVFPESSLAFRRQVFFADVGPDVKVVNVPNEVSNDQAKKIWQFKSPKDFQLNVLMDSLDITSQHHKTYKLEGSDKFRDIIESVLDSFLSVTSIPILNRIGLRYIDECPVPLDSNEEFLKYYNSTFPLKRFSLPTAREMDFKTVVKREDCFIRYVESIRREGQETKLILDFDGFAENIESAQAMAVTDKLHDIILTEYEASIKQPVIDHMRKV